MNCQKFILFSVLFFHLTISCKKPDDSNEPIIYDGITIVYIEGNNDLKQEAWKSINNLEKGLTKIVNPRTLVLAYIKDNDQYGSLLKLSPDNDPYKITSDTVKVFDAKNPSDVGQIRDVLTYIKDGYQSKYYNLILWSHGTSWAPAAQYGQLQNTFSFGEDRGRQIDIVDLSDALPMQFNYIIFDACSMASLEVLYEFRNKAKYIIASPTDILSEGFPYDIIAKFLNTNTKESVIKIARSYFDYYMEKTGLYQSASISVIDLSKIEQLASYMENIHRSRKINLNLQDVQRLDFTRFFPVPLYDFYDLISKNYSLEDSKSIKRHLDELIIFSKNTPKFLGNELTFYSGVTMSVISPSNTNFQYYSNLSWVKKIKNLQK